MDNNSQTTLLAPRPVRARRHQKSIISLEHFIPQPLASASIVNTIHRDYDDKTPDPSLGPFSERRNNTMSPFPTSSTPSLEMAARLEHLQINEASPTPRQNIHKRCGSAEFDEEIPFPSVDGETSMNNYIAYQTIPTKHRRSTATRSRKSSLLQSWDYQPVRISGADMVGETDVSLLMPVSNYPSSSSSSSHFGSSIPQASSQEDTDISMNTCDPPKKPALLHRRTTSNSSLSLSNLAQSYSPRDSLVPEGSTNLTFQPMQIYSPSNEAVSELFQIMRNSGLSPGSHNNSNSNLNLENLASIDEHCDDGNYNNESSGNNNHNNYNAPISRTNSYTNIHKPGRRRSSLVWPNHSRQRTDSGAKTTWIPPPSPVSRSTMNNPITRNDVFRREMEIDMTNAEEPVTGEVAYVVNHQPLAFFSNHGNKFGFMDDMGIMSEDLDLEMF